MAKEMKLQSSIEYLIVYGIAILIIMISVYYLYGAFATSQKVVPSSCQLSGGATCAQIVLSTNTITSNTGVTILMRNSGQYALANPTLMVAVKGTSNSIEYNCQPNYVKSGGIIICDVVLPQKSSQDQFVSGNIYLTANYCTLAARGSCNSAPKEVYSGQFVGYTQPPINTKVTISLIAQSPTEPSNNNRDLLTAQVELAGQPIPGATVNFTMNNSVANLAPAYADTGTDGKAASYIWSQNGGSVKAYANFSGASANTIIAFAQNAQVTTTIQYGSYLCNGGVPPSNIITITDANYSMYSSLSYSGSHVGVNIVKLTSKPITVQMSGSSGCAVINSIGGGNVILQNSGSNINETIYAYGPTGVNETIASSGSGTHVALIGGEGNYIVSMSGSSGALDLINSGGNVIGTFSGSGHTINITTVDSGLISIVSSGSNSQLNLVKGNVIATFSGSSDNVDSYNETATNIHCSGSSDTWNSYNGVVLVNTGCTVFNH